MYKILAIDSGNSFLKWGIFSNNHWIKQDKIENSRITTLNTIWSDLNSVDKIVVSHVSSELIKNQLFQLFTQWNIDQFWISAVPEQCGVINGYQNPSQLGSDRWSAIIAAWNSYFESCLVINVGTAMTVDVLSNYGKFIGGLILPGPFQMLNCLQACTSLKTNSDGVCQNFPTNTHNAVYSGAIHALVGAIERTKRLYFQQFGHDIKHCILSGGGAAMLSSFIHFPHVVEDNLVLKGLIMIINESRSR